MSSTRTPIPSPSSSKSLFVPAALGDITLSLETSLFRIDTTLSILSEQLDKINEATSPQEVAAATSSAYVMLDCAERYVSAIREVHGALLKLAQSDGGAA